MNIAPLEVVDGCALVAVVGDIVLVRDVGIGEALLRDVIIVFADVPVGDEVILVVVESGEVIPESLFIGEVDADPIKDVG